MADISVKNNPYAEKDLSSVDRRRLGAHIHSGQTDPHETADFYAGDGPDPEGNELDDGDEFHIFHMDHGDFSEPYLWDTSGAYGKGWDFSEIDSDWEDRDPAAMGPDGVVALPGAEGSPASGPVDHLMALFTSITESDINDDVLTADRVNAGEVILDRDEFATPAPLVYLGHPSTYEEPDEWPEWFEEFDRWGLDDGFIGLEAYSKESRDNDKDLQIWDKINTRFLPDRPVWGISAENSKLGGSIGELGGVATRFNTLLFDDGGFDPDDQEGTRQRAVDILRDGAYFIKNREQWDPDTEDTPTNPTITEIVVEDGTITIEAEDYTAIKWYSKYNREVATGETIHLEPEYAPFVRATVENTNSPTTETSTQPFGLNAEVVATARDINARDVNYGGN